MGDGRPESWGSCAPTLQICAIVVGDSQREESADRWSVRTLPRRLAAQKHDPWEGYFDARQGLTKRMLDAVG